MTKLRVNWKLWTYRDSRIKLMRPRTIWNFICGNSLIFKRWGKYAWRYVSQMLMLISGRSSHSKFINVVSTNGLYSSSKSIMLRGSFHLCTYAQIRYSNAKAKNCRSFGHLKISDHAQLKDNMKAGNTLCHRHKLQLLDRLILTVTRSISLSTAWKKSISRWASHLVSITLARVSYCPNRHRLK